MCRVLIEHGPKRNEPIDRFLFFIGFTLSSVYNIILHTVATPLQYFIFWILNMKTTRNVRVIACNSTFFALFF
jgi:hypothetical protein